MTLDEMLMWHDTEHRTLKSYLMPSFIFWLASGALIIGTRVWPGSEKVFAILMLCFAPWALISLIQMMLVYRVQCEYWNSLGDRIDKVPYWKRQLAEALEKDREVAWLWAIECEEAHINDCPLCGAV